MSTLKDKQRSTNRGMAAEFEIQICTIEGRLLSEYTLSRRKNRVASFSAAERHVRKRLANQDGAPLIIVISEDTIDEFRQTQSRVSFERTCQECEFLGVQQSRSETYFKSDTGFTVAIRRQECRNLFEFTLVYVMTATF